MYVPHHVVLMLCDANKDTHGVVLTCMLIVTPLCTRGLFARFSLALVCDQDDVETDRMLRAADAGADINPSTLDSSSNDRATRHAKSPAQTPRKIIIAMVLTLTVFQDCFIRRGVAGKNVVHNNRSLASRHLSHDFKQPLYFCQKTSGGFESRFAPRFALPRISSFRGLAWAPGFSPAKCPAKSPQQKLLRKDCFAQVQNFKIPPGSLWRVLHTFDDGIH